MSRLDTFVSLWELNPLTAIHYEGSISKSAMEYRLMAIQAEAAGHPKAAVQAAKAADDEDAALAAISEWMRSRPREEIRPAPPPWWKFWA